MQRRYLAVLIAVVLALLSIALVGRYVLQADARALASVDPVRVLRVSAPIAPGEAAVLGTNVEVVELPGRAVVTDALTDVGPLDGLVAAVALLPGEQVLPSRFIPPDTIPSGESVPIPKGFSQVQMVLTADRGLGTLLKAGDTVGIVVSIDEPQATKTVLNHVLVSRLALSVTPPEGDDGDAAASQWSSMSYLVTFAAPQDTLEEIVWSFEFGRVWLTHQGEGSTPSDDVAVTGRLLMPEVFTEASASPDPRERSDA